jgi:hypothetical protein
VAVTTKAWHREKRTARRDQTVAKHYHSWSFETDQNGLGDEIFLSASKSIQESSRDPLWVFVSANALLTERGATGVCWKQIPTWRISTKTTRCHVKQIASSGVIIAARAAFDMTQGRILVLFTSALSQWVYSHNFKNWEFRPAWACGTAMAFMLCHHSVLCFELKCSWNAHAFSVEVLCRWLGSL